MHKVDGSYPFDAPTFFKKIRQLSLLEVGMMGFSPEKFLNKGYKYVDNIRVCALYNHDGEFSLIAVLMTSEIHDNALDVFYRKVDRENKWMGDKDSRAVYDQIKNAITLEETKAAYVVALNMNKKNW